MRRQPPGAYRGYREAGLRLNEPVAPDMAAHRGERALPILYGVHRFDKAHLVMLAEAGLLPREDAAAMLGALRGAEATGIDQARRAAGGGIHSGEYLLIQLLGEEIGGQLPLGRSSADVGAVALRILERDQLLDLLDALIAFRRAVVDQARRLRHVLIAGRTQAAPAQPTTVGHILGAWGSVLERHYARTSQVWDRVNRSPAGAAIMIGTPFAINRIRTAALLGFDDVIDNTYDAVQHHDHVLETLSTLAMLGADLSRWSDDLLAWSGAEQRVVEIPDRFCGTSSILPQAKNPYMPQHVKGAGARSVGALMNAYMTDKGPTGIAVLDRHGVSAELAGALEATTRNLRWWNDMLPSLTWSEDRGARQAAEHFVQCTDITALLVDEHHLSWRSAHQIVAIAVRLCVERGGLSAASVTPELLDEAAEEYQDRPLGVRPEQLAAAIDARNAIQKRRLQGGPSPAEVALHCTKLLRRIEADQILANRRRELQRAASDELEAAIDGLTTAAYMTTTIKEG